MQNILTLQLGDNASQHYSNEYLLVDCKCRIRKNFNHVMPEGDASCDEIILTVIAPDKSDLTLMDWYISQMSMSGRIVTSTFSATNGNDDEIREILFEDAACFAISEVYDISQKCRRILKLEIKPKVSSIDNIKFGNDE